MAIAEIKQAVQYMRTGEAAKAVPLLEQVTDQMPQYATAHVLLARMYEAADRRADALRTWEHAAFLLPSSPTIRAGVRRVLRHYPFEQTTTSSTNPAPSSPKEAPAFSPRTTPSVRREPPASAAAAEALEAEGEDLDRLIEELETARIVPRPDLEDIPEPDLEDDIDDMVSETLARIYSSQEQYGEAARIYEKLATMDPERADEYKEKAAEMREKDEG